jgi:hypothetical protein
MKRRGSWRPCGYLTTVGTGSSRIQNRGRAQRNRIACSCWHRWWSTAGAFLGGSEGSGGRKTRCKVARRMAQWASSQEDEQQQGVRATNTPIWQNGPSSNDEVPHPLIDYGQGKSNNIGNNDPATGRSLDKVGGDVASRQEDGRVGRASNGEEDATGNDNANKDVPIAIAGVNYPIAGAPHPINKSGRLRKYESIPPPHGATPPPGGQRTVKWKSVSQPPPNAATPPLGGSNQSGRLRKCESIPPPHGAIPPLSGPMTVNQKSVSQLPPHGAVVPQATK